MAWIPRKQNWSRSSRVFEDNANPLRRSLDAVIGSQNYQEEEGGEWQEIDVTLVPNPIDGWDWGMLKANYEAAFREDVTADWVAVFRLKLRPNLWIRFKPLALLYCNDEGEREIVAMPQVGAVFEIIENKAVWRDAFGSGLDLAWWCTNTRLQKTVTIPSATSLPAPTIGGTNRCLALAMRFDFSPDIDAWIEDNVWDKETLRESLDHVHFRESPLADIAFSIIRPLAWDSAETHLEGGEEVLGPNIRKCPHEYRRQGDDLIVAVKVPLSWTTNPAVVWPVYIDVDVDEQVAAGNCDTRKIWNGAAWSWEPTADNINTGWAGAGAAKMGGGFVFTTVPIPNAATIGTAYLTLYGDGAAGVVHRSRISADDTDTAAVWSTVGDFDTRYTGRTTARVDWDGAPTWVPAAWRNSPEIKTVIQEIVDRVGWASGNNLAIFWEDFDDRSDHNASTQRACDTYDKSSAHAAKIHIEYTDSAQPISGPGNAHAGLVAVRII